MFSRSHPETRPAAVAGRFYPADADRLVEVVDTHLATGRSEIRGPKAVVAPHAGYVYSGPTAGVALATLAVDATGIERVVLLGPSHFFPIRGLAVTGARAFETPLGVVPVDEELREVLLRLPQVTVDDRAHAREHSLEVILPFLQRILGEFSLVPLVVGDASKGEVAEVLETVWGDDATRIVVSSDLSHYHDYSTARRLDRETCRAIERLDSGSIGPPQACGCRALNGLLECAGRRGLEAITLDLRNSGDTAGGRDSVVGYGAWAFAPPG